MISKRMHLKTSGLINPGPTILMGFLVGMDGTNDPTLTFYDNTGPSGNEVIPTNQYDASAYGLNGVVSMEVFCENGLYLDVSCAGTCEVVVFWQSWHDNK